ncbi:uncharacterized protein LOC141853945 [Brevipalpus obovatus]|uniref:uncharacterized protein LOC141853945 n=1 Tax=Brevipalpus obovatus TaxID=246614 RepID=UPI003D9F6EDE
MFSVNSLSIRFHTFLIVLFWLKNIVNCEIILSPADVQSICNQTRGMVNLGSDPSYVAEQVAEELESRFNLKSVTQLENLPTVNTERLMIRLLVTDFLGDRIQMINQEDEELKQRQMMPNNDPISESPTYIVHIEKKDKAKKGTISDVTFAGLQQGTLTTTGSMSSQDMSRIKAKNSDVKIERVQINANVDPSAVTGLVANEASQIGAQVANTVSGVGRNSEQKPPIFDSNNRMLANTIYSLKKCQNLDLNGDMKSSDPTSWWKGMENIRLALRREL